MHLSSHIYILYLVIGVRFIAEVHGKVLSATPFKKRPNRAAERYTARESTHTALRHFVFRSPPGLLEPVP